MTDLKQPIILLTGGGTAGHVTPNIALIEYFQTTQSARLMYVGSKNGMERQLIESISVPYYAITSAKLRRYLSWRNLLIPFQLLRGIFQSIKICYQHKPHVVFSKGGFIALPVVIAAWIYRIPVVIHESDLTLGLANRLSVYFARIVCVTFPKTATQFHNKAKIKVTGLPIRKTLRQGDAARGQEWLSFNRLLSKPILLVWGGSLGALQLNDAIRRLIPRLLPTFQIVHLCGQAKTHPDFNAITGYRQFEYLDAHLANVMACADLVISRAGATALYELLILQKPHILCPLSQQASRGDQIQNAQYLESLGLSTVIYPETLNDEVLFSTVMACHQKLPSLKQHLSTVHWPEATEMIAEQLQSLGLGQFQ